MPRPSDGAAGWRLRLARFVVRAAGTLVPRTDRDEWLEEWNGELHAAAASPGATTRLGAAWGAFPDAVHLLIEGFCMDMLRGDLRLALRALVKRPGFALVAVATLGLGIGANAILFSVVNGVLLTPYPYPEAERVVRVVGFRDEDPGDANNVSYPNMFDLDRLTSSFTDVAAAQYWRPALLLDGEARVLIGSTVTGNYFDVFGLPPALGRLFRDDDAGAGRSPRVVLSYRLWQTAFGGDSGVVGRAAILNNTSYTILGVTNEVYEDPELSAGPGEHVEIWRTVGVDPPEGFRSGRSWEGIARIRPGIDAAAAEQDLQRAMAGLAETYPEDNAKRGVRLVDLRGDVVGSVRPALLLLLGAVGVVLLIACANVASLLLSRALERRHEMAIRLALGAPRRRLVAQLMVESLVLSGAGALLGLLIAGTGTSAVLALAGSSVPRADLVELDLTVLVFTVVVAVGTAFAFGLVPALHAVRGVGGGAALASRVSAGRGTRRLQQAIVAGEIALSMVLLVGATLLVTTFDRLTRRDLGLEASGVLTMSLHGAALWDLEQEAAATRYQEIIQGIAALPAVLDAGAIDIVPLSPNYSCDGVIPEDRPPPAPGEGRCAEVRSVAAGAVEALGIPLRRGRHLDPGDARDRPHVMVVSGGMADQFWPGKDPIGERARIHGESFTVVGVVGDIHQFGPEREISPMVYLPFAQEPWNGAARGMSLVVRTAGDPATALPAIREVIRAADPTIPIYGITTLTGLLAERTAGPRFRSVLLSAFAAVALLLAVVGIGGVLAYAVRQRSRELGIRQAMGAAPSDLRTLVLREGMLLVLSGVTVGTGAALLLSTTLDRFLFGISARDPVVFLGGAAALALGVLVGCYLPARRAGRIDPVQALRAE